MDSTDQTTSYDIVAYPSVLHQPTHPERLAVAARLAGLDPAPMERARVLEIGGGTCLGLIAFAASYPGSRCAGFDLAPSAIARGRQLAGAACGNVALDVGDIMTAKADHAAGSFDYVIAHGVYAWVPEPVRVALLDLIAHVLSPRGVAFVSYNAMPGGHIRLILRDMLLHALTGIDDPEERVATALATLREYGTPVEDDRPLMAGLREQAAEMARRPPSVLFHDELGDSFTPHKLTDVVDAARAVGLRFLTDGGRNRGFDGFLHGDADDVAPDSGDDADREVVQIAQMHDYLSFCWFRATLLVADTARPGRRLDPGMLDGLWVSATFVRLESGDFSMGDDVFAVEDPAMAAALEQLALGAPVRVPVGEIARTDDQRELLLALYEKWLIRLHLGPEPFVVTPGERPETGAWIRHMLEIGEANIVTLAHANLKIAQDDLRALLLAADGRRSVAEIAALHDWDAIAGGITGDRIGEALREAAKRGLLVR